MSNEIAVKIKNIAKVYKLYDNPIDRLKETLHPFKKKYHRDFYALKNVSFEIKKGETVGIIGKNGSGKSTLLKIITGVLNPTLGLIEVKGKISALLELGAGFNPEFTGIENIYLNGTIMGYTKEEMGKKIPDIIEFADIGDFINQPVKTYSSGMFVRLAFAVAINVDPDILIVDEALAVGDDLFQRKCYFKIDSLKKAGKTIIFVSHSGNLVIELCDKAILLDAGEIIYIGNSNRAVNLYQKLLFAPMEKKTLIKEQIIKTNSCENGQGKQIDDEQLLIINNSLDIANDIDSEPGQEEYFDEGLINTDPIIYENMGARIFDYKIMNFKCESINVLRFGRRYTLSYKVEFFTNCNNVRFGMTIKTKTGIDISGAATANPGQGIPFIKSGTILNIEFEFVPKLTSGVYFLRCGVVAIDKDNEIFLDRQIDVIAFRIMERENSLMNSLVDLDITSNVFEIEVS
ncbi:teichoic acids export ATP-binding protein TagH [Oxobacter pfennigii]|uniref:Teichoic acids export ATP-binding protein TagH n=1 Tax=Oxobacter pfennigii TaxID=36849 RepID=A0A0P9AED5_9CLOT|nr:ABC transporter ATP-binding protein [Oxobacter pfennigii]KPU43681.1 teichoic acids export ATP-binding protein TagH [Oxobacter pfennigii]